MARWRKYVPVSRRKSTAKPALNARLARGETPKPVRIEGTTIARSFWGKAWCRHFDSFSDFSNRLPRGRTYVRNGSVTHLQIAPGRIDAFVAGSSLYHVTITMTPLARKKWNAIKKVATGSIASMIELLNGRFSDAVMRVVTDPEGGLFPKPKEITMDCSCPDWATMCKHVAATLYGVGNRLDTEPELLFRLRGVDAGELLDAEIAVPVATHTEHTIADSALPAIFGIDLELGPPPTVPGGRATRRSDTPPARRSTVPTTGKAIARLRKKLHLTVTEFADALGVSTASVYRWESTPGRLSLKPLTLEALRRLAQHSD